jgi:DNA-binding response OmpR family regulator
MWAFRMSDAQTPKILVIEVDAELRANLLDLLDAEALVGFGASNGAQGFALAVEHGPDLILCDVTTRDLDDFGLCTRLRDCSDTAHIPLIFISAHAEQAALDRERGMCGGSAHLTKPFALADVLSMIATRLARTDDRPLP